MAQTDWKTPGGYTLETDTTRPTGNQTVISLAGGQKCVCNVTGSSSWTSNTIVAYVKFANNTQAGFVGFYCDDENLYAAYYNSGDLYWYIDKCVLGTWTNLAYLYDAAMSQATWYKMKFTVAAGTLTLSLWDDTNKQWVTKLTATDTSHTSGTGGIYTKAGDAQYDDLKAVEA